jgi:hypothetical protein
MIIQTRVFDAALGQFKRVNTEVEIRFRESVNVPSELASVEVAEGDARFSLDNNHLYVYVNGAFVDSGVFDVADLLESRLFQSLS